MWHSKNLAERIARLRTELRVCAQEDAGKRAVATMVTRALADSDRLVALERENDQLRRKLGRKARRCG